MFVATKKQAQLFVAEEAKRLKMPYVTERWLGGMLTNFKTIQGRIRRLKELERMEADGSFEKYTKKEVIGMKHQMEKLEKNLGATVTRYSPEDSMAAFHFSSPGLSSMKRG